VTTLPMALSLVALLISCVALWKNHFARFSPLALAGNLQHRVYPIRSGDERWNLSSFDVPVSVTNPGAMPGRVTGMRLRLHYPELPFVGNYELIFPKWELDPKKLNSIDKDRFRWIDEVVIGDWSSFVVLPKTTVTKHLLFETRWDKPVVQRRVVAILELRSDERDDWRRVSEWTFGLPADTWVDLESGRAMVHVPDNSQEPFESQCSPPDLHKYTGTKANLPTQGALESMEPSRLDYHESDEN